MDPAGPVMSTLLDMDLAELSKVLADPTMRAEAIAEWERRPTPLAAQLIGVVEFLGQSTRSLAAGHCRDEHVIDELKAMAAGLAVRSLAADQGGKLPRGLATIVAWLAIPSAELATVHGVDVEAIDDAKREASATVVTALREGSRP